MAAGKASAKRKGRRKEATPAAETLAADPSPAPSAELADEDELTLGRIGHQSGSDSDLEGAVSLDSDTDDSSLTENSDQDDLDRALVDVVQHRESRGAAAEQPEKAADGELRPAPARNAGPESTADVATDSSEDERKPRNTVGDVPLEWYKNEDHVGYTRRGKKLQRNPRPDRLDALLAKNDLKHQWRTIYDEYNDEEITLSREEVEMLQRIRAGQFPHVEVNPYEPEADWFSRDLEIHPLSNAPEPKRRFMISKWEEKKIVKLVRALRRGWIKREKEAPKEPEIYLMWGDDGSAVRNTASGLQYLPATKAKLPGHGESYNPPKEYLPSEEEKQAHELMDEEDRPDFLPQLFPSLRKVPAYEKFIKEQFERCLDLYLCPRGRRKRPIVSDPQTLVPKMPKPQDLQPFPTTLLLQFLGHKAAIQSISLDGTGQWLASGSDDGTIKVWEAATGRCLKTWDVQMPVKCVAWCPDPGLCLLAAAFATKVLLLNPGLGTEEVEAASVKAVLPPEAASDVPACQWQSPESGEGLELAQKFPVKYISWHGRGDYFATVAPTGNTQAVLVHRLSKKTTQNPFRKGRGRIVCVRFHASKPIFFVAALNHVFVYDLSKQTLLKKLKAGAALITSMDIHSSGDHVLIGTQDERLLWFDLDLSTRPYRIMRYHEKPLEAVAFHRRYPLFASASADATVHVFHGMVYQDLLTNPLIVPVKVLRGHKVSEHLGVLDCAFHPRQPWIFSAGGDATIRLFTN